MKDYGESVEWYLRYRAVVLGGKPVPVSTTDLAWTDFTSNPAGDCLCPDTTSLTVNTGSSKKMDGIWNRYNLKGTRRIYTFRILKCSEKFAVLDLP